jgi:hypothetical protein
MPGPALNRARPVPTASRFFWDDPHKSLIGKLNQRDIEYSGRKKITG